MKLNKFIRTVLGCVALSLVSSVVYATTYGGQNTYLGAFAPFPGVPNTADVERNQGPPPFPNGNFADFWIFSVAPSALIQVSADFVPFAPLGITGWGGGIFSVTGATCTTIGTSCTGVSVNLTPLLNFTTDAEGDNTQGVITLAAGTYAILLHGNNVSNPNQTVYTGQVSFLAPRQLQVPEPASLALLGIGLIGLALARRRKSS